MSEIYLVTYVTTYYDTEVLAAFATEEAANRYVSEHEDSANCEVVPMELDPE